MDIQYRPLAGCDITMDMFSGFDRYQEVKRCWRKIDGEWRLIDHPFIDNWSEEDKLFLLDCLLNTLKTGGLVHGAFSGGRLIGFCSVENEPFGSENQYLQLSCIHVSNGCRGGGVGRRLFEIACESARALGGKKLYISAHSAEETQRFYKSLGCTEALEYNQKLVEAEPVDCQLELRL